MIQRICCFLAMRWLGNRFDAHGDHWLHVGGKGGKGGKGGNTGEKGKVAPLPGLARRALEPQLVECRLPVAPAKWYPATPLTGRLDGEAGITAKRLWAIVTRFPKAQGARETPFCKSFS
ncbi:MAG: hypothetical protein KGL43_15630 [Burkholderiales bacterium]|nr:hypothetical protein [Burkholderiales bacterium]MDE2394953.1 hypothetical protein [Burkholderiales bacterium]MDE2455022.1 hypothetical protein [Burkholderiales bacterium]